MSCSTFRGAVVGGLIALFSSVGAFASDAVWKPGTPVLIDEDDIADLLWETHDYAYCQGVRRFGHRGSYPHESFVVFDCSVTANGETCTGRRYKALRATRRNYFRLQLLRPGSCY